MALNAGHKGPLSAYHNTLASKSAGGPAITVAGAPDYLRFSNNVVSTQGEALHFAVQPPNAQFDVDNMHSANLAPLITVAEGVYASLSDACTALEWECSGHSDDPAFSDSEWQSFGPKADGSNIDRAARLYGMNDSFAGSAPDIGYVEFGGFETAKARR